jgi:hypothetical protein
MNKKELMKAIADVVGRQEAIRLVAESYHAEIVSNRLSRMETSPIGIKRAEKKDLLQQALERVYEVVALV